jgi:small subunit ribosomal protein S19
MSRSVWKSSFIDNRLIEFLADKQRVSERIKVKDPFDLEKPIKNSRLKIRIVSRDTVISTFFLGLRFQIHNGKKILTIRIQSIHLGKKFGEFSFTRKVLRHKVKKVKSKK